MLSKWIRVLLPATILGFSMPAFAAGNDSTFSTLPSDVQIVGVTPTVLLTSTIYFNSYRNVLAVATGRYYPVTSNGIAIVSIWIDGIEAYSNRSKIDFRTTNPVQHSFDAIAAPTLGPGSHTFQLVAYNDSSTPSAQFRVGSSSGLSVMTDPAPTVVTSSLSADSSSVNVSTCNVNQGDGDSVQYIVPLSHYISSSGSPIVSLVSGSSYYTTGVGDAAWRIRTNWAPRSDQEATWSANDLTSATEKTAPMYGHSFVTGLSGSIPVELGATELALGCSPENAVVYNVAASTRLVSLSGMQIVGRAYTSGTPTNAYQFAWASTTDVPATTITIPSGHNGVVLFLAKVRAQADPADTGGTVFMFIQVDGVNVGTGAVQEIKSPNGASTRTLSASYLATGANSLSPGTHTVTLNVYTVGSFAHLAITKDVPVIYLD